MKCPSLVNIFKCKKHLPSISELDLLIFQINGDLIPLTRQKKLQNFKLKLLSRKPKSVNINELLTTYAYKESCSNGILDEDNAMMDAIVSEVFQRRQNVVNRNLNLECQVYIV